MWHRQYFCIYIKYFWLMIITIILSISAVGKCAVWLAAYPRAVWIPKMVRSMHDIQSSVHLFVCLIKMVTTDEHVFINIQSNYLKYLLSLIATRHVIFMCAFWTSLKSEITIRDFCLFALCKLGFVYMMEPIICTVLFHYIDISIT